MLQRALDWSGVIFVSILALGLIITLAELEIVAGIVIAAALIPYALCWYNFARLSDKLGSMPLRVGLAAAIMGIAGPVLGIVLIKAISVIGWILLGLALFAVTRSVLRTHLIPDGFAWASGAMGVVTIAVGIFSDVDNDGAGPVIVLIFWALMMTFLYLGWGQLEERDPDRRPMNLRSPDAVPNDDP